MRTAEITGNMNPKRKILMTLFWINKKVAVTEGCAPFIIEKIITENSSYFAREDKFLKLSGDILSDVLENIENHKIVEFGIKFGKEYIKASIHKDCFSVSTTKTKYLEGEIIEKLEGEAKKKYPNVCSKFYTRLGVH